MYLLGVTENGFAYVHIMPSFCIYKEAYMFFFFSFQNKDG